MQIGEKKEISFIYNGEKITKMWKSNPLLKREIFFIII